MRPDEATQLVLPLDGPAASRCNEPAGESPVPVGAGAPGSRPQACTERCLSQSGVSKACATIRERSCRLEQSEVFSLDKKTMGEPSRSFHGEGHVFRGRNRMRRRGKTPRGMGTCRQERRDAELERPVHIVFVRTVDIV